MTRTEMYRMLKQQNIDEDRKQLLNTIDRLIQEAELLKHQINEGQRVHSADLAHNAAKADSLTARVDANIEIVSLLDSIAEHDIATTEG